MISVARRRIFSVVVSCLIVFMIVYGIALPANPPVAAAVLRTLDTGRTDMAAHMLGTQWHGTGPQVVDFGPADPLGPVAGIDQWLTRNGRTVDPRAAVSGTKKFLVMRVGFADKAQTTTYAQNAADMNVKTLLKK